jgi:hypothetical protein
VRGFEEDVVASTVADRVWDRLRGRGADTVFGYVGDRINRLFEGTFDPPDAVVHLDPRTPGNSLALREDAVERYCIRALEATRR